MKKILTVFTGGTICTAPDGTKRDLHPALAKRALLAEFAGSASPYAKISCDLFVDSGLEESMQTLSENMTIQKLDALACHIRSFDAAAYSGIIILHGTDTLAFTAALFSVLLAQTPVPVMLVSSNKPPMDETGNANANFRIAVELIMGGIAPNVYVPYQNCDGRMWLHLGKNLMQCENFTDDFKSASESQAVLLAPDDPAYQHAIQLCSKTAVPAMLLPKTMQHALHLPFDRVLLVIPYPGLNYDRISLDGIRAVVHGTYHSGTLCTERNQKTDPYTSFSALHLAEACRKRNIALFAAPCRLDTSQYASAYDAVETGGIIPLDMTLETAYAKALVGVACDLEGESLKEFMLK